MNANIGRVSLNVELDGKPCLVLLPEDKLKTLVRIAAELSENNTLKVYELPKDFYFGQIGDEK